MTRATITFDDDLYFELSRLAKLQGKTKSALLNELMSAAIPFMQNTSDMIEKISAASESERRAFKRVLGQMELLTDTHLRGLSNNFERLSVVPTPSR